jgi:hypothetical protein
MEVKLRGIPGFSEKFVLTGGKNADDLYFK